MDHHQHHDNWAQHDHNNHQHQAHPTYREPDPDPQNQKRYQASGDHQVSQPEAGTQPLEQQDGEELPPGSQHSSTLTSKHRQQGSVEHHQEASPADDQQIRTTPPGQPPHDLPPLATAPQTPQGGEYTPTTPVTSTELQQAAADTTVIDLIGPDTTVSPGILPTTQQGILPTEQAGILPRQGPAQQDPNMSVEEPSILPQKRTHDAMFTIYNGHGNLQLMSPWSDGSPTLGYGPQQTSYFRAYAATQQRKTDTQSTRKDDNESDTTAASDSDAETQAPAPHQRLTRQEAKQLDRELPWREIWATPKSHIQKFLATIKKEANSWAEWGSIRPLSEQEIEHVRADPQLRRRVLRSPAAYCDKNRGQGKLKAKCRIVALGHCDPDIYNLTRSSPTSGRTTEHMLFAMSVAGMNSELGDTSKTWKTWLGDAATAFLQGKQANGERRLPLYMARPRGPLIDLTPFWKTDLYEVLGNIYGLPNTPYCQEVINPLKSSGYIQHDFGKMLFCKYDGGSIISLVMCYVDDFYGLHREDYDVKELHDLFRWGELRYF